MCGGKDEVCILRSRLAHLDYKASHDELTGVLNRTGYELLLSGIDYENTYMIMLDVNNFKAINDTCGHDQCRDYARVGVPGQGSLV